MARSKSVPGEKALFWVGFAKDDLLDFPEAVKDAIGLALSVAQFGGKHPNAKPWKGIGPGVLEVVADHRSDTYRAVYVLHAFQKKSPTGRKTAERDVELISRRLRAAADDYEARYGERKKP
jgi:phage-related protein